LGIYTPLADQAKLIRSSLWIEVDLLRLHFNLRALKHLAASHVAVMAVVKANAYGHGLVATAKSLGEEVEWFGVASLSEGIQLRKSGLAHSILVFGHLAIEEIEEALHWDLTLSLSDMDYAACVHDAAVRRGAKAKVHVKVDTGMGRFGFSYQDVEKFILNLSKFSHLELEGLYTHFPQAEMAQDPFTLRQIESFKMLVQFLRKRGLEFKWLHTAGSSAIVHYPESHFNLIRPGLMLYGLYPHDSLRAVMTVRPVLSLRAKLALVKKIASDESVGYGRTFVSSRDTQIGILPVGYSHGYPWALGDKGRVLFRGNFYPVVGRISMDSMVFDLGPGTEASLGETVTLIGQENDLEIHAEELASEGKTIPYEIVTRLHAGIERVYL